ncbi:MAG: hypothetical protein HYS27_11160 [Deltaproteobacteria bacterium]|nr:hypothetical protein [Deltaproteobacteria bacterium]
MVRADLQQSPEPHDGTEQQLNPVAIPTPSLRSADQHERVPQPVRLKIAAVQGGLRTHTCLQCGLNPVSAPVPRKFLYVPPWVYIGLALNVVILLILYFAGRQVVQGSLSLCPDCDRADKRGRFWRALSVLGLIVFPIAGLLLGVPVSDAAMGFGAASGLVAGIAGMVAAARKTRADVVVCKKIDKKAGTLELMAAPEFGDVINREAPEARA